MDALARLVAETFESAARFGLTAVDIAAATIAAAAERRGRVVRVLLAECTAADASYDVDRLREAFDRPIEVRATLLDDLPECLIESRYDLVATTTFHAQQAQQLVGGRLPVVAMLVGARYVELVHEVAKLSPGARIGIVSDSAKGIESVATTLRLARPTGIEIFAATADSPRELWTIDRRADLILITRGALTLAASENFSRPERLRHWTYEFDPAAVELLRRAVLVVAASQPAGVSHSS